MNESSPVETPSEALARRIADRLVQAQLISPRAAGALARQLATGKMRAEDWRLPIELGAKKDGDS